MNVLKKIILGVALLGMISGSCIMANTKLENLDLAETRILLEEQLALLSTNINKLTEEEQYKLAVEKKNLEKAINHLKELEEHKGVAEYWQKIKSKATKGTIIAVAAGVVAAAIGIILIWKGIRTYREMKADRDAERTNSQQLGARLTDQINTLAVQYTLRGDALDDEKKAREETFEKLQVAEDQLSSLPLILKLLEKHEDLKKIPKAENRVGKIKKSVEKKEKKEKKKRAKKQSKQDEKSPEEVPGEE